ncbi:hypothetical protein DQ237_05705 [Blastococcus sp. TF02-8]|uniref:Ig-like domain-containing protein n=1 Tax=Blastococcus sp. TF02-8 TaxID=2250574 RepID=UPI000DEBEC32|nr:Ig-like domain-containing protein [Blastococcus sp. TF02-8]RBY97082.1 hypothetical protein DQ237_05705 [Blastococcus sp. TF02-8]
MRSLKVAGAAALIVLSASPAAAAPVNQAPVAVDDTAKVRNTVSAQAVYPLDNDSDPEADRLTYTAVTSGAKGTVSIDGTYPTWLRYRPLPGATAGTDSFTYTVSDGNGNTATATVTVTLWDDVAAPAGVTIRETGPDAVTISWPAVPGATQYRIHRGGRDDVTTTALSFSDSGFDELNSYSWHVGALNGGGFESSWSNMVSRSYPVDPPRDLTVDVTADPTALALDWEASGSGPWNVYRDGSLLTSTTATEFEDTGLTTGRAYSYQVQATYPASPTIVYPPSRLTSPVTATAGVLTLIDRLFLELGGARGGLGPVTVDERAIPGGLRQDHENGIILQEGAWSPVHMWRAFADAFDAAGGVGTMGFPLDPQDCGFRESGCAQFFESGSIWGSPANWAVVVPQLIEDGWAEAGWEEGPLGYPAGSQVALARGLSQPFEDGAVYWSAGTGSHGVSGENHDTYTAWGGPAGRLGFPTTGDNCGLRADGCWQGFQGGTMHWTPTTGAHVTDGAIRDVWGRSGWENGRLGYPVTDAVCGLRNGGCWQGFQGGTIHWTAATGAQITDGAIRDAWGWAGWENGRLGYPTGGAVCGLRGGGCWQGFQGGTIHWSPATGAHATDGAIRDAWGRSGWENGRLGYPTTDVTCGLRGGGCWQGFQGGTIHWTPGTGARITDGAIRDAWGRAGWETGRLGYPTGNAVCGLRGGGCWQGFQGGTIHWSPAAGAHPTFGAIRDAWGRAGWENGRLGYPTTDEMVFGGVVRQNFQGGYITLDQRTGRVTVR